MGNTGQNSGFPLEQSLSQVSSSSVSPMAALSSLLHSPHTDRHMLGLMKSEAPPTSSAGVPQCREQGTCGNLPPGESVQAGQNVERTSAGVVHLQQQQNSSNANFMMDFRLELEKKNHELFDMQRRLLEQQMLMEQERNQFYQVAQQVMQCIGNTGGLSSTSALPANVQLSSYFTSQASPANGLPKQPATQTSASSLPHHLSSLTTSHTVQQIKLPATPSVVGPFPQAQHNLQANMDNSPYTHLQQSKLLQSARKPAVENAPYSLLLARSTVGVVGQNGSTCNTVVQQQKAHAPGNTVENTTASFGMAWQGAAQKTAETRQEPGQQQPQQHLSEFQRQQKPAEYPHQQQQQTRLQQQLQSNPLGALTSATAATLPAVPLAGLNLPQTPQLSSVNLPHLPLLPSPTPGAAMSFTAGLSAAPTPYQSLTSQMKLSSLPSHPSLHNLPVSLPNAAQTANPPHHHQSDLSSSGVPLRLPNDEEIQSLLDAIQMKCSNTTLPSTSSASS